MSAGEVMREAMKLFVFPFVYCASVVPVVVAVVVVLTFVEYNVGWRGYEPGVGLEDFTTLYLNGDVVGVFSLLLFGGLVFGLLACGLARLEGGSRPSLPDHLRRCSFLYVFVGILGTMFVAGFIGDLPSNSPMYEVPKAGIIWVVAGYAIFVDALMLAWQRRRSDSLEYEGTA